MALGCFVSVGRRAALVYLSTMPPATDTPQSLLGLTPADARERLADWVRARGLPSYRAGQVHRQALARTRRRLERRDRVAEEPAR